MSFVGAPSEAAAGGRGRIDAIDVARGVALVAMATYHFAWDLEFFGYLEPGTSGTGALKIYARAIASSFLFLVGVSLVLAHGRGIRWRPFARRWVMVAGAAALITVATWFATPESFVFFGILHHIALASLLGLLFLPLPWWALVGLAVAIQIATPFLQTPQFADPATYWTGLSSIPPRSNDFVPVLPWFSATLGGMAAGKLLFFVAETPGALTPGGWRASGPVWNTLAVFGRWSLTFYLLHQPILIALVYGFSLVAPPDPAADFARACQAQCTASFDAAPFTVYCACAQAELTAAGKMQSLADDPSLAQTDLETGRIIAQCAFEAGLTGKTETGR
ncbi:MULTISPECIES: heparan-alpha-glucosaminide N-acetyltransferase [unclassified Roseitalea]|uniref:heparan-alpha-glucosaminide N-acetyltransferase n=1 Tax=unclassified Roseitalea TaxID=2639107 RepID=UPI00273F803B|nr:MULTISPECIES: heparan-alpha-glucosaminide N-acetyltransferase [unclassified Roseitalea]